MKGLFQYGERYSRGQESALYLLKDLLEGEGDWWRAFNQPDHEKFTAPTVTDAEYPKLGFSVACNDETSGILELESYAATSSARGQATRFCVRNLRDSNAAHLRRDGVEYGGWRATSASSIEIETTIGTTGTRSIPAIGGAWPTGPARHRRALRSARGRSPPLPYARAWRISTHIQVQRTAP